MNTPKTTNPLDDIDRLAVQRGPRTKSLRRALRRLLDRLAAALEEGDEAVSDGYGLRRGQHCPGPGWVYDGFWLLRDDFDEGWAQSSHIHDGTEVALDRADLIGLAKAGRKLVEGFQKRLEREALEMDTTTEDVLRLAQEIDELAVVRGVQLS